MTAIAFSQPGDHSFPCELFFLTSVANQVTNHESVFCDAPSAETTTGFDVEACVSSIELTHGVVDGINAIGVRGPVIWTGKAVAGLS